MAKSSAKFISFFFYVFLLLFQHVAAQTNLTPDQALARSIFKELIEIPTVHSTGNTTIACEAMAKRLIDAGYAEKDIQIVGPESVNRNLVVRLHGSGKRPPLLMLSHLDVVEARRSDWSRRCGRGSRRARRRAPRPAPGSRGPVRAAAR